MTQYIGFMVGTAELESATSCMSSIKNDKIDVSKISKKAQYIVYDYYKKYRM